MLHSNAFGSGSNETFDFTMQKTTAARHLPEHHAVPINTCFGIRGPVGAIEGYSIGPAPPVVFQPMCPSSAVSIPSIHPSIHPSLPWHIPLRPTEPTPFVHSCVCQSTPTINSLAAPPATRNLRLRFVELGSYDLSISPAPVCSAFLGCKPAGCLSCLTLVHLSHALALPGCCNLPRLPGSKNNRLIQGRCALELCLFRTPALKLGRSLQSLNPSER